jgi:hypothetical protein
MVNYKTISYIVMAINVHYFKIHGHKKDRQMTDDQDSRDDDTYVQVQDKRLRNTRCKGIWRSSQK